MFRKSLKTKNLKVALHRKRLLDFIKGDDLFKMITGDYELVFEYDTKKEFETYLKLARETQEVIQQKTAKYEYVNQMVKKQAKNNHKSLNFFDLEFKFVDAKKKAGKVTRSTYKAYEGTFKKLQKYFYKKEIADIIIEDYEDFRDYLAKEHKLKNKTINNHITYTNKFLDFSVSRKLLKENHIKGIESLKEDKVSKENFTDKDIKNILSYDYEKSVADYFLIAAYSGMRLGEIHQITNENIIEKDGIYFFDIIEAKTGNGIRKVPIHKDILERVLKIDFPIFKGKTTDAVQKLLNRRLYKVIDKKSTKSFHTFRAKFIEKALNDNPEKLLIIQEVVGHSKNSKDKLTIETYAKGFSLSLKADLVDSIEY